jgi:hypothetical protein
MCLQSILREPFPQMKSPLPRSVKLMAEANDRNDCCSFYFTHLSCIYWLTTWFPLYYVILGTDHLFKIPMNGGTCLESQYLRSRRQEDGWKFKASLGHIIWPCLKIKQTKKDYETEVTLLGDKGHSVFLYQSGSVSPVSSSWKNKYLLSLTVKW